MCTIIHTVAFETPEQIREQIQDEYTEIQQLRTDLAEERTWREELAHLSIDQQVEIERLRAFQAEIFEVYGGNYDPEGRLADLSAVIERSMSQS